MRRLLLLVFVILLFAAPWSSVRKQFEEASDSSFITTLKSELSSIFENETLKENLSGLFDSFQSLIARIESALEEDQDSTLKQIEKPKLDAPADHLFSIYNISCSYIRSYYYNHIFKICFFPLIICYFSFF